MKNYFTLPRFVFILVFFIIFLFAALSQSASASTLDLKNDNDKALKSALALNKYIIPYSELTRENISLLPGRYAVIKNIPSVDPKSDKTISAASNIILKITKLNKKGFYSFEYDNFLDGRNDDKKISKFIMKLETKNNVPTIFEEKLKSNKKSRGEKYIALRFYDNKFLWIILDSRTQELTYLQPLNNDWFPSGFLNGEWKEKISGSTFIFTDENMRLLTNGKELDGSYVLDNNRMYLEFPNGDVGLYYVAFNPETQILSLTKIANDGLLRAMNLERTGEAPVQARNSQTAYQPSTVSVKISTPRRQRRSDSQYESDFAKITAKTQNKNKNDVIEQDLKQASQSQITQSSKSDSKNELDFEKFGKDLITSEIKSQPNNNSEAVPISEATESTETTLPQTQNSNPQYAAKLPDSGPEDEEEYEGFSGTYEYRGNGESSVIRFKDNGQFVEEGRIDDLNTTSTTTGTYSVKGNTITLHNKYISMNGGMTVETNSNNTWIIDRKNNILLDNIDSPNIIYRGANMPIWKRKPKPQASKRASAPKSTETTETTLPQTQVQKSKPADEMFPGYYFDD